MCRSLASTYSVSLVVADGLEDEQKDGVRIFDVGRNSGGRLKRMTHVSRQVLDRALSLDGDIYHLHDPELLPIGMKLLRVGKRVIFDAHEDFPKQLRSKPYLGTVSRVLLSRIASIYENRTCSRFDAIVGATPSITRKFQAINRVSETINNFPILGELESGTDRSQISREVTYVGGMSQIRGIEHLVSSMTHTNSVKLNLIGEFGDPTFARRVRQTEGFASTEHMGFLERTQVRDVLARSAAGIVTFLNSPNHIDAQPNKMFEYMSAGIPLISSNFPLWREIVEGNECGLCVDPTEPAQIGSAIQYIVDNPEEAREMGENGRRAVVQKYNWGTEEAKLLALYRRVIE